MHDCLPSSEAEAIPSLEEAKKHPAFKGEWTGDVYKTILHFRSFRNDLFVCVVNIDHGVGIVKRGEPENILNLRVQDIKGFSFSDLEAGKDKLLNLKPKEWFFQWLELDL